MSENGPESERLALVERVLAGYREGAFPMAISERRGRPPTLGWYEADPRGVIRLGDGAAGPAGGGWRLPRRLVRTMRSGRFAVTSDEAFGEVIRQCADPRRPGGWIDGEIVEIFEALHGAGVAHSVEVWAGAAGGSAVGGGDGRTLVGGLYGLTVGAVFCGESMFSRPDLGGRDASKVALAHTILHLVRRRFALLDTQMWSEHVAQFGCEEVSRGAYLRLLGGLRDERRAWGEFDPAENLRGLAAHASR